MEGRGWLSMNSGDGGEGRPPPPKKQKTPKEPKPWAVGLAVVMPVFKTGDGPCSSGALSLSEFSVQSDTAIIPFRQQIIDVYTTAELSDTVDTTRGKLYYSSDSRNKKMIEVTGSLILLEAFGKCKNSTKILRFAMGAFAADSEATIAAQRVGTYLGQLRNPREAGAASGEPESGKQAARRQEETRSLVAEFADALYWHDKSPFRKGFCASMHAMICQFIATKQAAKEYIITDWKNDVWPTSFSSLVAGRTWDTPMLKRANRELVMEKDAFQPHQDSIPTAVQIVNRRNLTARGGGAGGGGGGNDDAMERVANGMLDRIDRMETTRNNSSSSSSSAITPGPVAAEALIESAQKRDRLAKGLEERVQMRGGHISAGVPGDAAVIKTLDAEIAKYQARILELSAEKNADLFG
ncbi:hypothetical protein B484DRAFT_430325 [Ochromonadaceae sp. CCMP2298]|nr:hypothetical protein B484DRAFT_430325 [Ochromonadaceae sp. CCMP2298]